MSEWVENGQIRSRRMFQGWEDQSLPHVQQARDSRAESNLGLSLQVFLVMVG